ncbi:MAG: segregation/condensation protein A [Euryarchaeota archaeon]|nr:segregation/condensation protein A [Euryarchaeota archaeon]
MLESELYEEIHPVDMLVDLVISEEMDPWDIDIAEIAQRFLEKVRRMQRLNLRLSGRAILAAAILLRMKSEALLPREEPEEEEYFEQEEEEEDLERSLDDIPAIPVPMRRREVRRTTLFELVEALQRALGEEMLRRNFPRTREKPKLVIQVDEEGIKEKIARVYERVRRLCSLSQVVRFFDIVENSEDRLAVVETLLCLLYLDSQRKVNVWQEELFGEIFVSLVEN